MSIKHAIKRVVTLQCILVISFVSNGQLKGKIVGVSDGDTYKLLTDDKRQIKIRLHGIDCPEKNQDFGQVAKKFTSDLIFGRTITVKITDVDRYGRSIGITYLPDGRILNEELLKAGLAWHYTQYDKNPKWTQLEQQARKSKRGLWQVQNPTPPWAFRKQKRTSKTES